MPDVIPDSGPIRVVPYDPSWPDEYQRERAAIFAAIGDLIAAIEHVGSTAVPGLGAKPVIDIMIGVHTFERGEECVPGLEGLDYLYRGEAGIPGRHYFRKPQSGPSSHHIHMVPRESDFWRRHILFRDYLRGEPDARRAYYELKLRLAEEYRMDREGYTEAKTEFIQGCLARAAAS